MTVPDWVKLKPKDWRQAYHAYKIKSWYYGCQRIGKTPAYEAVGYSWHEYNWLSLRRWQ